MEYSVWLVMEQRISITKYATAKQLKAALTLCRDEVIQCATIISDLPKRLRKYIEAQGGNFEHLL